MANSAIGLIDETFIHDLLTKPSIEPTIANLFRAVFMVRGEPLLSENTNDLWKEFLGRVRSREIVTGRLSIYIYFYTQHNSFIKGDALYGYNIYSDIDANWKYKLQKFLQKHPYLIIPQEFDTIDALCGVLSFILLDLFEYYGIRDDSKNKENPAIFNREVVEYYTEKLNFLEKRWIIK